MSPVTCVVVTATATTAEFEPVCVTDTKVTERTRPVVAIRVIIVEETSIAAARSREENAVAILLTGDFITIDEST